MLLLSALCTITGNPKRWWEVIVNKINNIAGLILLCSSGVAHSAVVLTDTFDTDIGTWTQNTTETSVGHSATGGNPDGYMTTTNIGSTGSFGAIGAQNNTADYAGLFSDGLWAVSVDLSFISGDFTDSWLRFRGQDSSHDGWHISLEDSSFDSTWQSYSVTFDTTWSDAVAMANGWVQEEVGLSFSTLWDNVWSSEVRILGDIRMEAGIDNYNVSAVPVPAAIWLFGTALIGLAGFSKRRKAAWL
jgi:hypothetical protein